MSTRAFATTTLTVIALVLFTAPTALTWGTDPVEADLWQWHGLFMLVVAVLWATEAGWRHDEARRWVVAAVVTSLGAAFTSSVVAVVVALAVGFGAAITLAAVVAFAFFRQATDPRAVRKEHRNILLGSQRTGMR